MSTMNTGIQGHSGNQGQSELREKAKQTKQDFKQEVGRVSEELRGGFSNVKEDVRDLAMTAGRAAREQLDPVEEYVREYPVRSLLMAVGAGMILGMIFRR